MTTIELALTPRDGLFCKDGRGWFTDALGRGNALDWPYPSTVLGALRSAWGRARERQLGERFVGEQWRERTADLCLGPTLTLRRPWGAAWDVSHRLWPAPADAWLSGSGSGSVTRLIPTPDEAGVSTIGRGDSLARERLWRAKSPRAKPRLGPRWWSEASFVRWLRGDDHVVELEGADTTWRLVTHVTMSPETGAAEDEKLFSHDVVETLELDHEWALAARLVVDEALETGLATLGSDRRLAPTSRVSPSVFGLPASLREHFAAGSQRVRLYVVTPAIFGAGWLPDGLSETGSGVDSVFRGRLPGVEAEVLLRAAFVGRPLPISGWDMARGRPKPTSRAVPPGSVYAFERADGAPFTPDQLEAMWLARLGERTGEGFGRVVPGCWHPSTSPPHS